MKLIRSVLFVLFCLCGDIWGQRSLVWDDGATQGGTAVFSTNSPAGQYTFRITTTNTAQSVGYWRTALRVTSGEANLYLKKDSLPTVLTNDVKSEKVKSDHVTLSLTNGQEWYILVNVTTNGQWSLCAGDMHVEPLSWDSGTNEVGVGVSETNSVGEDRYYKIVTENADLGMWRTALKVTVGDAGFYLKSNALAVVSVTTNVDYQSNLAGDDGVVVPLSSSVGAGQVWYVLVKPQVGSAWSLFSGDLYVRDLGDLATNSASSSGLRTIPAEGVAYYKTKIPGGTLAWRLWLQDQTGTNTLNQQILVRKGAVTNGVPEQLANGQLLVVPSLLDAGSSAPYYVAVSGNRGSAYQLDSRKHTIDTLSYGGSTNATVQGFLFKTYRIDVPPDQIAWELLLTPQTNSNPDMAVHYARVPNPTDNLAFSELVSSNKSESITLVPPQLSSGSYYITIYSTNAFSFGISNRQPVITPIAYISDVINDDVNRSGWRYYAVTDINQQLGSLGWDLFLQNQVNGSLLAIRRNNIPGQWSYRENGSITVKNRSYTDKSNAYGRLQDPDHAADVWYVGVYTPTAALGAFRLSLNSIVPSDLKMDGDLVPDSSINPGNWRFYQVDITANGTNGNPALGWELRIPSWSGVTPNLVVRRGVLPKEAKTSGAFGSTPKPHEGTAWDSGSTWLAAGGEWTGYVLDSTETITNQQVMLSMAMGRPLQPGRYYIGVYNPSQDQQVSFYMTSKAIGQGMSHDIGVLPVNGTVGITNLEASGVAYYRIDLPNLTFPQGTKNWKFKLRADAGETMLYIRKGFVPTLGQEGQGYHSPGNRDAEEIAKVTRLRKTGDEYFVLFPENTLDKKPQGELYDPFIPGGTYYCMVVSEGVEPGGHSIGSGFSSATLESVGTILPDDLGVLNEAPLTFSGYFADGEIDYLKFTWGGGTGWYQVDIDSTNPAVTYHSMTSLVPANDGGGSLRYGGMYSGYSVFFPPSGRPYSQDINIIISDTSSPDLIEGANYNVTVSRFPYTDLAFDGAKVTVTGLCGSVVYKMVVPEEFEGWEFRLTGWTGSRPSMTLRREYFPHPDYLGVTMWSNTTMQTATNWPIGYQWGMDSGDWTLLSQDPLGLQQHPQYVMSMAKDRPMVPGVYYIALDNPDCSAPATFSFETRAIGNGYHYNPTEILFDGGSYAISNLPAREVQYFKVEIPEDSTSWAVKLENTVGESSLYIRKDFAPTIGQDAKGFNSPAKDIGKVTHLQKNGDEYFVLLPATTNNLIPAGTYYLMAVSLGQNPTATRIGTTNSSAILRSLGQASIVNLGLLPETGELIYSNAYAAGQAVLCQFTVPEGVRGMEVRMLQSSGYSMMHMDKGLWFPPVSASVSKRYAGLYSGNDSPSIRNSADVITISQPTNGVWSLLIADPRDPIYLTNTQFKVSVLTLSTAPLQFFGGSVTVTNLSSNSWTFLDVRVPPPQENGGNFLGWELKMSNWTGLNPPHLVVRRNALPDGINTKTDTGSLWTPADSVAWPPLYQWGTTTTPFDWTFYRYTSGKTKSYPEYILSMANNRPLEPGSYLIGIFNPSLTTNCSVTLSSRVIGGAMPDYPVTALAFNGGIASISNLPVRGIAYYQVTVPEGAASWNIHLDNVSGESSLFIRKDYIPTWTQLSSSTFSPDEDVEKMVRLKRTGDEHYTLTPKVGASSIPAGEYYLMVVSEGVNPNGTDTAGSGSSSAMLKSLGPDPVLQLGTLNSNLTANISYEAGDVRLIQFLAQTSAVPVAFELRLTDRVGMPFMSLRPGSLFPKNDGGIASYYGGMFSQTNGSHTNLQMITVANATPGLWSLVVSDPNATNAVQNGSCRLDIREHVIASMNGDSLLNTNGLIHQLSGTLVDQQRAFYSVDVPETLNGQPVLGWRLSASVSQGSLDIRARNGLLPDDTNKVQTAWGTNALMVVPPFLSNGTWYVEVKGVGSTSYQLTSEFLLAAKRTWTMPATGENSTTPGLFVPLFGDTGVGTNGVPLAGDQGVDLVRGQYDVYSVVVPTNNTGLLATRLEAISGNPNLFVRYGNIPTINHTNNNQGLLNVGGYLYDRALTNSLFTEYGNWVPLDGRNEAQLTAGVWYLMVKAEGASDARYRLKLSCGNAYSGGNVQSLDLNAGSSAYTGQTLAKGDWRYYRVEMPDPVPFGWVLHSAATQGDVDLYVRDSVPPGHGITTNKYIDWTTDDKMAGNETNYVNEGSNVIGHQLLKPGETYYVGVVANVDATFSIGSTTNGGIAPVAVPLDFYTGFVSNSILPSSSITYRIAVPTNAVRWRHTNSNPSTVQVNLKQGGWPTAAIKDKQITGSGSMNQFLFKQPWPWLTGEYYYLTVTNTSSSSQTFVLTMNGSSSNEMPTSVTASDGTSTNAIVVSWNMINGALKYSVYRSSQTNVNSAVLVANAVDGNTWNDVSAARGVSNYYWVAVYGAPDTSWFSVRDSGWWSGIAEVSPQQINTSYASSTNTITVSAGSNILWSALETLSWASIITPEQSNGNGIVKVTLTEHVGGSSRTGRVFVAGNWVTIVQTGFGVATNVQASDGSYADTIVITWDLMPSAAFSYYVRRAITNNFADSIDMGFVFTNKFIDGTVSPDRPYYYWVRPRLTAGYGDWSKSDEGSLRSAAMTAWVNTYFPGGYDGDDADPDGDGFTNKEEYIAGTSPTDAFSLFDPDVVGVSTNGYLIINVPQSVVGRIYDVEWKESLMDAGWTGAQLDQIGFGGTLQLKAPLNGGGNKRFYRPVVQMDE